MNQETRQNITESNRFIDDSQLSKREQRVREAIFLYYMEDMTQQEIADKIGVTRPTVSDYLNSDEASYFEPVFSSKEKGELKRWLQDGIYNTFRESQETLRQIKQSGDAKPSTVTRASVELQKNWDRLINLLQELQELEKPKERKQVEQSMDTSDVRDELSEIYKEKQEGREDESKEGEA